MRRHMVKLAAALWLIIIIIGLFGTRETKAATPTSRQIIAKHGCPAKCGDVEIPYPFGVGDEKCFLDTGFNLTCDGDSKLWTTQFQYVASAGDNSNNNNQLQIRGIDLEKGTMDVDMPVSRLCFDREGKVGSTEEKWQELRVLKPSTFSVSGRENKFFAVGCDTYAFLRANKVPIDLNNITDDDDFYYRYATGCISTCVYEKPENTNDCSGNGCCNLTVPSGMREIQTQASYFEDEKKDYFKGMWNYSHCSYSFVAKNGWYNPHLTDLTNLRFNSSVLVIDWAVGNPNQTCDDPHNINICAAVNNTQCVHTKTKSGYHCRCKHGYQGNPYLRCQNECKDEANYPCHENARCYGIPGSYTCTCNKGFEGDGEKDGKGCVPKSGVSLSVMTLLVLSFCVYRRSRKRRLIKLKEQFFQQNGGIMLTQQLGGGGKGGRMKIYTLEELQKATNNFDEKVILGQGGFGTVYKGTVEDRGAAMAVAIKKSKNCKQSQVEQFINEVVVLSQINHRNVVNLLGCCLEERVPLLVYEFINNGTLSDHLHASQFPKMSFATRLRVAVESAGALSYLHSAASPPIIHRDVKAANILLDDRLTAKVSDFGTSRLVSLEQTQITTMIQGTFGYLDPEYIYTGQLTEKSDVYSFGVVLAELLTGEKAISLARPEEDRSLSAYFISSLNNGRLAQVLDSHIVINGVMFEHILEVAEIARRCLNVKRDDRPTMKEVAMELEGLRNHLEKDDRPLRPGEENEMSSSDETLLCVPKKSMIVSSHVVDGGDSSISIVSGGSSGNMDMSSVSMSLMRGGR